MLFSFTGVLLLSLNASPALILSSVKEVRTVRAAARCMTSTVSGSGSVFAVHQNQIYCGSSLVKKVLARVGEKVKKGQLLFTVATMPDTYEKSEVSAAALNGLSYAHANPSASAALQKNAAVQSQKKEMRAPADGIVTLMNAQEGETVSSYEPAAVVTDLSELRAKVLINEISIADVKKGQTARITGKGFHTVYHGTIKQIYPAAQEVQTATGTVKAVAAILGIKNPGKDLKPGLSVTVKIETSRKKCLILPYRAVGEDSQNREFAVLVKNHRAFKKYIKTGKEYDSGLQILRGVKKGECAVLDPPAALQNGQFVITQPERKADD